MSIKEIKLPIYVDEGTNVMYLGKVSTPNADNTINSIALNDSKN